MTSIYTYSKEAGKNETSEQIETVKQSGIMVEIVDEKVHKDYTSTTCTFHMHSLAIAQEEHQRGSRRSIK